MTSVTDADRRRADQWLDRPSDTPARRSERDRLAVRFARCHQAGMIEGARLMQEAAAGRGDAQADLVKNLISVAVTDARIAVLMTSEHIADAIRALDPAAIVKGKSDE